MLMTMCSKSVIVPVREFAGIESARLILGGKAAETALLISSWRNVRRSVVIDQSVYLTSVPLARRKRYIFQKLWKKLESPCALRGGGRVSACPRMQIGPFWSF